MLLGVLMLAEIVMMGRLMVMMRGSVVVSGRLMVMLTGRMLRCLCHLWYSFLEAFHHRISATAPTARRLAAHCQKVAKCRAYGGQLRSYTPQGCSTLAYDLN
jgi:hypothetical protein